MDFNLYVYKTHLLFKVLSKVFEMCDYYFSFFGIFFLSAEIFFTFSKTIKQKTILKVEGYFLLERTFI